MNFVDNRNRTRVSSTHVRDAGFRPGQRVAVERSGSNTIFIRPFNRVRKGERLASYTVEQDYTIRMSSNKIGRFNTKSQAKSNVVGRSTIKVVF